jgi:hypothetical protein
MQSVGWLERLYGDKEVSKMKKGVQLKNGVEVKIESILSLKKKSKPKNSIFITMGIDDKGVMELDEDVYNDGIIIAVPWTIEGLKKWLTSNNPTDLRSKKSFLKKHIELDCILKIALDILTDGINLTTGLSHSRDEELAKTYIRTLYRYHNSALKIDLILGYLTAQKHWQYKDAKQLVGYIEKLKLGQSFKGGSTEEKTHKHYFSIWKEACEENKMA